jgi:hypothetical protein
VLRAGAAEVSGIIHPRAAGHHWVPPPGYDDPTRVEWPDESGGSPAYADIYAHVEELRAGAICVEAPDGFARGTSTVVTPSSTDF